MRVAIYSRISRDTAGESLGVARQEKQGRELAARRGFEVAAVYTDNDISAWSGKLRPAYTALLTALADGSVDGVVVWHIDRLVRSMRDLEDVIELDRPVWTCIAGEVDLSTDAGRAIARTLTAWGRYESDVKSRRLRSKHEQLAQSGAWASGRCFGYTADGEVIDSEGEVIRDIAARLLRGESLRSVTRSLVDSGTPTVKGGSWRGSTVRQMITAARLSGQREWTPRSKGRGYGMGEIIGPGEWDAIISPDETARLRALFSRPRVLGRPVERLLSSGLAHCARCGRPLQAAKDERQGRRYACIAAPGTGRCGGISVAAEPLEAYVCEAALIALEGSPLPTQPKADTAPLVKAADSLRSDLDALADDHGAGRISRAEWLAARQGLAMRLAEAERALGDAVAVPMLTRLPDSAEAVRDAWPQLEVGARRRVLGALLDGVIVGPARVRGRPRFDPDRVRLVWRA
jgi:site-specific DNA recombinase